MRGFDLRTVGPRDPATGLVIGGNKSLLFNAEYLITIAGPVRLVLFYDAGQVRDRGEQLRLEGAGHAAQYPGALIPTPATSTVLNPFIARLSTARPKSIGDRSAFKSSTGAEIRFFMPV